jgi:hypothetical protein
MGQPAPASLDGLKEIALPPAPSWLPQTIGWYVLLAIVLAGLIVALLRWLRHWRRNRYRAVALAELNRIEGQWKGGADTFKEIPELVKRTALRAAPRVDVASLSGEAWLKFLDDTYAGSGFTRGPGKLLPVLAYAPERTAAQVPADQMRELFALIALWIRRHHAQV